MTNPPPRFHTPSRLFVFCPKFGPAMCVVRGRQLRRPILLLTTVWEEAAGEEFKRATRELTPRGSDAMVVSACLCCRYLAGTPLSADFWEREEGITLLGFFESPPSRRQGSDEGRRPRETLRDANGGATHAPQRAAQDVRLRGTRTVPLRSTLAEMYRFSTWREHDAVSGSRRPVCPPACICMGRRGTRRALAVPK